MESEFANDSFFDRDVQEVAKELLGTVLEHYVEGIWLSMRIIETEAYYGSKDRGSHASLGFTEKRRALFMDPGTIYMYFSRAGDSLNFTCRGHCGDAVLIKSGFPLIRNPEQLEKMRQLNPPPAKSAGAQPRSIERLCNGQSLLCKSLGLKVKQWDCQRLSPDHFRLIVSGDEVEPPRGMSVKYSIQTLET